MIFRLLCTFVTLAVTATEGLALDICDHYQSDPVNIQRLVSSLEHEMPAPVFDSGNRLQIRADTDDTTIAPRVVFEDQAVTILVPRGFFYDACVLSTITQLAFETRNQFVWNEPMYATESCAEQGGSQKDCFKVFVSIAEDVFRKRSDEFFSVVPRENSRVLTVEAYYAVMMHELAHYYLRHDERIATGEITRPQAEFEADTEAIFWALANGRFREGYSYFVFPIMVFDLAFGGVSSSHYDSPICRDGSIRSISRTLNEVSDIIIHLSDGSFRNPDVTVALSFLEDISPQFIGNWQRENCQNTFEADLNALSEEINALVQIFRNHIDVLVPQADGDPTKANWAFSPGDPTLVLFDVLDAAQDATFTRKIYASVLSKLVGRAAITSGAFRYFDVDSEGFKGVLRYVYNNGTSKNHGVMLYGMAGLGFPENATQDDLLTFISLLEISLKYDHKTGNTYWWLADAYLTLGLCHKAKATYERGIEDVISQADPILNEFERLYNELPC